MTEQKNNPEQLELLLPDFIDEAAIAPPPYHIRRVNTPSGRHYLLRDKELTEESVDVILPSITTLIRNTSPVSPFIIDKMIQMGKSAWDEYLEERSEYGTTLHIIIGHFVRSRSLGLPFTKEVIDDIGMHNTGFNHKVFFKFEQDIYSDLLAFSLFFHEYEVEPLAMELPLGSSALGFAGTLDLVARMTIKVKGYWGEVYKSGPNKGAMKETIAPVRVLGIVDFKSGRHGFYRQNELQLKMSEMLLNANYPDLAEDLPLKLFNWAPKDWRDEPSYSLTEQTDKVLDTNIHARVKLFNTEFSSTPLRTRKYEGVLELGNPPIGLYYDAGQF